MVWATIHKLCRKCRAGCLPMIAHAAMVPNYFYCSFFPWHHIVHVMTQIQSDHMWVGAARLGIQDALSYPESHGYFRGHWPYRFRSDDGSCSGIRSIFYLSPTRFSTNPRRRISACMPFTIKASCMQKNRSFMPFRIAHAIRKFKTIWWNQQNSKPDPHSHDRWTFQLSNCDFLRWSLVVAQSIFSPKLEIAHSGLLKFLEVTKVCT